MKIKMLSSSSGAANPEGAVSMTYKKDEIYDMSSDWQQKIANAFVSSNLAMEVKVEEVKEEKIEKEVKKTKKKKKSIL
jgi:hypothetical protein|tara:strand:+ start:174 stop:407 length:234 start_codon:yes stop_codon:yes gene_type:complete